MIRHIVFWKFRAEAEGRSAAANRDEVRTLLEGLPARIPGILEWEVGVCAGGGEEEVELCLCSLFENPAALAAYTVHPDHRRVVDLLRRVRAEKRVADYETGASSGQ